VNRLKRSLAVLLMILLLLPLSHAMAEDASKSAKSPIRLGGKGDDTIGRSCFLPLSNGNLLLSISTHKGRNGQAMTERSNGWLWLICLKPDGSTLWETEFGEDRGTIGFGNLMEKPDQTVMGYMHYSIDQHSQYRQKSIYSLKDGKLLWQGEREVKTDRNIYVTINTVGSRYLRKETHDAKAKCEPRYYQLEETDGTIVWCVEDKSIGLNNLRGALNVPQGTLLYGCQWDEGASGGQAKAMLMNDQGKVLWTMGMDGLNNSELVNGLVHGSDQVLLTGSNHGPFGSISSRFAYREGFLLLLDTATGRELWRRLYRDEEEIIQHLGIQFETEQGFLLANIDISDYSGFLYQWMGFDGSEHTPWQVTFKDTAVIGLELFQWNGEIWQVYTIEQDGDMDVVLERLAIPEQAQ
jgi:outer membrane protein assembly factor BamB